MEHLYGSTLVIGKQGLNFLHRNGIFHGVGDVTIILTICLTKCVYD